MKKLISYVVLVSLFLSLSPATAKTYTKVTLSNGKNKIATTVGTIEYKYLVGNGYKLYTKKNGVVGASIPVTPALYESSLASPISASVASLTLVRGTDIAGNSLSGYMCFTIDSGSPAVEFVCGTASSTNVTGLTRGIDPITGVTSVTSLKFSHRRGANVKITDYPVLSILARILNGDDTLPSGIKFNSNGFITGLSTSTPTDQSSAMTLYQFQQATTTGGVNGSETVKGVYQLATQIQAASRTSSGSTGARLSLPASMASSTSSATTTIPITNTIGKIDTSFIDQTQYYNFSSTTFSGLAQTNFISSYLTLATITPGNLVTISTTTGQVILANASSTVSLGNDYSFLGVAMSTTTGSTSASVVYVQSSGIISYFSGLNVGLDYYVPNNTGSSATSTAGYYPILIGKAISSTSILLGRRSVAGSPIALTSGTTYISLSDGMITASSYGAGSAGSCAIAINSVVVQTANNGGATTGVSCSAYIKKGSNYAATASGNNTNPIFFTPIN